jgi:hypothetical protein
MTLPLAAEEMDNLEVKVETPFQRPSPQIPDKLDDPTISDRLFLDILFLDDLEGHTLQQVYIRRQGQMSRQGQARRAVLTVRLVTAAAAIRLRQVARRRASLDAQVAVLLGRQVDADLASPGADWRGPRLADQRMVIAACESEPPVLLPAETHGLGWV